MTQNDMSYLIGIDLGTSGVKVVVVEAETLKALAIASEEYPIHHPQSGYAEQNPDDWWDATVKAIHQVTENISVDNIAGISFSGQMHGIVCLDSHLQPIHPAIIWADSRSTKQVEALKNLQSSLNATLSGLPATGYAASSFLWLHQNEPELLQKMDKWCLPKDYIRSKMTGTIQTEASDAASTWLYDVVKNEWSQEVFSFCGLTPEQMPHILSSTAISGHLTEKAAQILRLKPGIPIITGSADLPAQAIGQGIFTPDTMLITVGTGGQIFIPTLEPIPDPHHRYYLLNHNLPDSWYLQSAILSGGLSLRWLRDLLNLPENAYGELSTLAETVPAGAAGLLFLPYLAGERSPIMDSQASGVMFGLRLHHGQAHFARAIMEGVAFALKDCYLSMGQNPEKIVLSGGITKSSIWIQILSDILEKPLYIRKDDAPHGAIGAAILAGIGIDLFSAEEAIALLPQADIVITPQPQSIYRERFEQYRRLYPLLKDEMHLLSQTRYSDE